jgi:prepilin signal peptidase PulO-like enzyme (type II secretory pathway)
VALTVLAVGWRFFETYSGLLTYTELLHAMAAAGAGAGFLFFLWFISKGKWIGFGDVKLAFPLGVIVGTWQVFSMIVLSFWIGAGVSILIMVLMKLQRGKLRLRFLLPNLTMKSVVPFAPFLVSGCLVVLFTKFNVLTLFTF